MAGRPRGDQPRNVEIKVRVTADGKATIIAAARPLSVSDYIRKLVADDIKRREVS